jgi:glyoxylase-like metal-dependent hydrolase (beta-lactamase superfamily II)
MRDVERIADDLYLVKHPFGDGFVGVTVVLGKHKIGLVDTGFEGTPVNYVFPFLRELGRRPEEINFVVNTHRDGDHVGGNRAIKKKTKAKIAIHEFDAEIVETVDFKLKDEDVVELGEREFKVIHTPGHTPGSICLYDQKNYTLVTGDSVCGERSELIRMDKKIYISSLKKLLNLEIEALIMAHPFKPLGKSILVGEEPREMIYASLACARAGIV